MQKRDRKRIGVEDRKAEKLANAVWKKETDKKGVFCGNITLHGTT